MVQKKSSKKKKPTAKSVAKARRIVKKHSLKPKRPARKKLTLAARAKKHGVSEVTYKRYLAERKTLAKKYLGH